MSTLQILIKYLNRDNTCEINLMDAVEKKDVKPDQFEKGTFKDTETVAGKYAAKNRKSCARIFTRKATAWVTE